MTDENVFPKSDGDALHDGDVNQLYTPHVITIYTGSDFDKSTSGTADHTIQLASGSIDEAKNIVLHVTYRAYAYAHWNGGATPSGSVAFDIKRQETGSGSWNTLLPIQTLATCASKSDDDYDHDTTCATLTMYLIPTSGETNNGIDIKFTTTITQGGDTNKITTMENIQTVIEGRP